MFEEKVVPHLFGGEGLVGCIVAEIVEVPPSPQNNIPRSGLGLAHLITRECLLQEIVQ
jgi:hypothetical protein